MRNAQTPIDSRMLFVVGIVMSIVASVACANFATYNWSDEWEGPDFDYATPVSAVDDDSLCLPANATIQLVFENAISDGDGADLKVYFSNLPSTTVTIEIAVEADGGGSRTKYFPVEDEVLTLDLAASWTPSIESIKYITIRTVGQSICLNAVEGRPFVTEITVDIKPSSTPNTINLGSNGVIPVAILSSDAFDALTVNPGTVQLAGKAGVRMKGNGAYLTTERDVNGDGLVDLELKIEVENLQPGDIQTGPVEVTGQTYGEDPQGFIGTDFVTVVPPEDGD